MFVRMLTVKMRPGNRYVGEKLAKRWYAGVATLPGFIDVTFFGDDDTGEYGYFSRWETREAAETCYAGVWRDNFRNIFGVDPRIDFYQTPIVVDNKVEEIVSAAV